MVQDFVKNLNNRFDKRTLSIDLPKAFDNMKGKDAKFEFVLTSTIQPLKLHYDHNIVKKSIAYIFWQEEYKKLTPWKNAETRAEDARKLYKEILNFDDVQVIKGDEETSI